MPCQLVNLGGWGTTQSHKTFQSVLLSLRICKFILEESLSNHVSSSEHKNGHQTFMTPKYLKLVFASERL